MLESSGPAEEGGPAMAAGADWLRKVPLTRSTAKRRAYEWPRTWFLANLAGSFPFDSLLPQNPLSSQNIAAAGFLTGRHAHVRHSSRARTLVSDLACAQPCPHWPRDVHRIALLWSCPCRCLRRRPQRKQVQAHQHRLPAPPLDPLLPWNTSTSLPPGSLRPLVHTALLPRAAKHRHSSRGRRTC
jgi:hypothetical protein